MNDLDRSKGKDAITQDRDRIPANDCANTKSPKRRPPVRRQWGGRL
jgi:hypothetical protein